ncbi:AMP-binding protein [Halomicroarcula sp. GCM10025817]|uniref:AMP-binding protein n=1 Tax=Haloarcula TaxID=2237 RepID=UPI0023E7D202|nr:AMP-binding protein [Halomicroarcula sp. SYNS111]
MTGNWTGYTIPEAPTDYEALRAGFAWQVPETYNIAAVALDGDPDAVALRHVPDRGSSAAVSGPTRTVTYGDLASASAAVALRLAADGVKPGDRVAVCLPQCPEQVVVHLAAYRLGAVVVPVSMLVGDGAFDHTLTHAAPSALFVDERRWDRADLNRIRRPETTVTVRVDADRSALGGLSRFASDAGGGATPPMAETAPEDPALVLYTSGTSSDPKGVVQGHQYLLGSMPGYHCWYDLFDPEAAAAARVWTPSEWAWAGALFDVVFPTLAVGGTVVSSVRRRGFDPDRALDVVERQRVTHAFLPPTALRKLRESTDVDADRATSLSVVMSGGEPLPDAVATWAEETLGVQVNEAYGQTEANALAGESQGVYPRVEDGLGRPYPGHHVAVIDDDGDPVPDGEVGEIAVARPDPVVMVGYLDDPDSTQAVLDDRWLRTGDLGRIDADGTLEHLGRADELVVSSGYRISPLEVEAVLTDHPSVAAALVSGEPDPERGQRVVASVVLTGEGSGDEDLKDALRDAVADQLGAHKKPHVVEFVSDLPTTRTDKTDRSGT